MPQNCKSMSRYSCITRPLHHLNPRTTLTLTWVASFSGSCFPSFYHLQYEKEPMRAWGASVWEWGYTCYSLILRLVGDYCQTVMVPGIGGMILYWGKLARISEVLWLFCKSFLCKIWKYGIFWQQHKGASVKVYFLPINSWKFSPSKVSRYTYSTQWVTVECLV